MKKAQELNGAVTVAILNAERYLRELDEKLEEAFRLWAIVSKAEAAISSSAAFSKEEREIAKLGVVSAQRRMKRLLAARMGSQ